MYTSKKILLICVDIDRSTDAIEQAVELAHINSGNIFVKLIVPDFPKGLSSHHAKYVKYLTERLSLELEKTCEKFGANAHLIIDSIVVHSTQNAPIDIIKQVMLDNIDVVIKQKQPLKNDYGISSFDMGLLRKCPCPVWLCNVINNNPSDVKVAVAIDVHEPNTTVHKLNLSMVASAAELALDFNQELTIISCWENVIEAAMLQTGWLDLSEDEVNEQLNEALRMHKETIYTLLEEAKLSKTVKVVIELKNGIPSEQIPAVVIDKKIDVLIMGTLARTGIAGFIMGNTSENIVQKVQCSLIAFKPDEFISPVTPN